MDRFKNKYRIASARAQWWDYGWNGLYFVTICTRNREHFFGEITNGTLNLSAIGHIANSCWHEIPNHFPFVELGAHIIMPNHVHGIVIINKQNDGRDGNVDGEGDVAAMVVETQNFASLPLPQSTPPPDNPKNQFGPQSKNLASIIRGFKVGVTKNARQIDSNYAWLPRFHDHIIRNDEAFQRISNYIINNPGNWKEDKFYNQ